MLNTDPRVEGLPNVLAKESGGAYLADLPTNPKVAASAVKGATLEIRVARDALLDGGKVGSDDTLRLDYKPDVDYDKLVREDYEAIAEKVYSDSSKYDDVKDSINSQAEFDAFRVSGESDNVYRLMPIEWNLGLLEEFEEKLADFDEAIETCAETPPELDQAKQSPIEPL